MEGPDRHLCFLVANRRRVEQPPYELFLVTSIICYQLLKEIEERARVASAACRRFPSRNVSRLQNFNIETFQFYGTLGNL